MIRKVIVSLRDWYLVNVKWKDYQFGKDFHAGRNVFLWAKKHIIIGNNCYIGRNSQIECNATIGDNVLIANNVAFLGKYDHCYQEVGVSIREASEMQDDDYSWLGLNQEVFVGDDVWIGYGTIILSGTKIQSGCIIAAGSILTKDTEPYCIYAGSPAKKVSTRFKSDIDLNKHLELLREKNEKN
jgi:acetyltransferase-like isoleucine patch superfamily enzyme